MWQIQGHVAPARSGGTAKTDGWIAGETLVPSFERGILRIAYGGRLDYGMVNIVRVEDGRLVEM